MRGTWRRRLGAYLLALCLCLTLLPTAALAADGPEPADPGGELVPQLPVGYIVYTWDDETGLSKTTEELQSGEYTEIKEGSATANWSSGWYVVQGNVNISSRVTVSGTVNLILKDSCTLNATTGIQVAEGSTLNIYGQTGGTGALNATGGYDCAGIGGNGGDLTGQAGGTVTIHGGTVTAQGGGMGAGIGGGGGARTGGAGGSVTIHGGTVTAISGDGGQAAGIGGGGGGKPGTLAYLSIRGDAVVFARNSDGGPDLHISKPTAGGIQQGIVFKGDQGQVYGNVKLSNNLEIPTGYRLTLPTGRTLTIPDGVTLTVSGDLEHGGTIAGNGTIAPDAKKLSAIIGLTNTDKLNKVYDGTSVTLGGYISNSNATPAFTWHRDNNGNIGDALDSAPTDCGTYWVKMTTEETGLYRAGMATKPFTISRATPTLTLTAEPAELSGGGTVTLTLSGVPKGGHATVTCDSGVAVTDGGNGTWTAQLPNQTADYIFTASYEGDGNHNRAEAACAVSVSSYDPAAGNRADVSAARAAIGSADWTVPQAAANTPEAVEAWIEGRLETMDLRGVDYDVTVTSITPAVAGAAADRDGTNGSFGFTVSLSKGSGSAYAGGSASVTGGVITATPYNKWTVTVTAGTGGTVSGGGTYEEGSTVTVTAAPSGSRYYFIRWTENGAEVSREASYTFTLTADRTLTAEFGRRSSGGSSSSVPEPEGPSTGGSEGWRDIRDEVAEAEPGDTITIDMGDETEVPGEIFEEVAGKDVTVEIDLGGGVSWTVNGQDVPEGVRLSGLNLGVRMDTSGIPVSVFNAVTGEYGSVQFTLAHDGVFGFAMTLSAPLGRENAGYWANLYWYNEGSGGLEFVTSARIGADGSAALRLTHASQYAVVIDDESHEPVTLPFTDVPQGAWYEDAVRYVYEAGLMTGTSSTTFAPNDPMTRAMLVTILWRMAGSPVVNYLMDFDDVDPAAWYGEAVRWAVSEGIAGGYGGGLFGPGDAITREQLAVMLWRFAQHAGYDTTQGGMAIREYADYEQISDFALEAMNWAVNVGIIGGTSATTLSPSGSATRAQAAVMLQRFCERFVELS